MGDNKPALKKSRLQCIFLLPNEQEAFGDLVLRGRDTSLSLASDFDLSQLRGVRELHGKTFDGKMITCLDCVMVSCTSSSAPGKKPHYLAEVFPHYTIVGNDHLDPAASVVCHLSFTTSDLTSLFYDFDAFGHVIDAKSIIDVVLAERRRLRPVEAGEWPQIAFFNGKGAVIGVDTDIGKFSVHHRPSSNMGGPQGVYIRNEMVASLEPTAPLKFEEAIQRLMTLLRFLAVFAGREQKVGAIHVSSTADGITRPPSQVHWSHAPRGKGAKGGTFKPQPIDLPLDPIRRPEEFSRVLRHWIAREQGWLIPRVRYLAGLRKGNSYDADRLIAAANMFDILPEDAVPKPVPLAPDLATFQADCLASLKKLAPSIDRNAAIAAIKRMGAVSLPKKVQHRTALVERHLGSRFTDLSHVVKLAVQCRNYLVHGSSDADFNALAPHMSLLTDSLEFVFAASDFIESGWDAGRWIREPHSDGHTFARFNWGYEERLADLRRALA